MKNLEGYNLILIEHLEFDLEHRHPKTLIKRTFPNKMHLQLKLPREKTPVFSVGWLHMVVCIRLKAIGAITFMMLGRQINDKS